MHQELDEHVEQVVSIIARRVHFVADEVELWCDRVAAQYAALRLILAHFFDDVVRRGFFDVAENDVAAEECSWRVWKWMQLRVQVGAEEMKNDSSIARDVLSLIWLGERDHVEFVVLHAAALRQLSNALNHVLLVGCELEERNKLRQHRDVLNEMLVG